MIWHKGLMNILLKISTARMPPALGVPSAMVNTGKRQSCGTGPQRRRVRPFDVSGRRPARRSARMRTLKAGEVRDECERV